VLNVRVCGALEVEADQGVLPDALFGGRQGRLVFAFLVCERHRAVRREELAELLWPDELPDSWSASLSAVVSRLRRLLSEAGVDGPATLVSAAGSYQLLLPPDSVVDLEELAERVDVAERAAAVDDVERALTAAAAAEAIARRGFLTDDCEWVDRQRASVLDQQVRAVLARSVAQLAASVSGRAVEAARDALSLDPSRETSYRQLMRALAAAGERGEALRVWERCRITLVEELGVDPAPETERVYLEILGAAARHGATSHLPSGVVTFLLTDILESSAMWEADTAAMAAALERHDAIVGQVVTAHGGTLLKSKLEGDATVSVFARATECAGAALALLDALAHEPWPERTEPRLRMAMHTGEAFERGGDYFGPALNRAARLRSIAGAGEVLMSQAVAELVRDILPDGVVLRDRGHRDLRGLSRGENVYELARAATGPVAAVAPSEPGEFARPPVAAALTGGGPFVGRDDELAQLGGLWARAVTGESGAVFIGGEPGVGKSRLAGELAVRTHATGGLILYGRCDEDLGAPLQPFIEALRALVPALGATRLRTVRGIDELRRFVPALAELLGEPERIARADPDTERLALFDAVTQLLCVASAEAPALLVLDDLHWAGKTTLSLLRHLLRGSTDARLLIVGTYRDTELARTHPLASTLADLRRDADVHRIALGGLAATDVDAYLTAIGNNDHALGRELAELTSGNPFFLIEVLRHVDEAGGAWEPGTLPEGVREATGRRLSRLSNAANDALAVAAVVGTTFDLALVEQVQGVELIEEIVEASQAGLVMEEPGTLDRFRFAHALVRQVLLAELVTLKRVRLHRTIAELLEAAPTATDPDTHLADLAYHWFECASAGGATKAVDACRRAADRAMERLAYEEAGDLYGMALQACDAVEDGDPDTRAALHLARCDALLTAGDVVGARDALDALELTASGSEHLAAWYTIYEAMLAVLAEPDRLTDIVQSIGAAAEAMHADGDLTGEAKAHHVHASALERLGQIGAAERALDAALAAARATGDRRLADAILAEAPPAALWGPSPIPRASGRCLDVVRVLRITGGAPAVEAVALRCQAVLEALRGRMDAARRMIGTARRTVEKLGLTHRRLETEVAAGIVELLDGQSTAAETCLRSAYDELRARGLGGEAAQAGAFLGRALLLQDRLDEAEGVAHEAEQLAGSDLKAAIHWRDVRALVAMRRGDTETALTLAREAVELASATDALLLVADARLTLAIVLHTSGHTTAADAEAQRAVEACDAKGITVLLSRIRDGVRALDARADNVRETVMPSSTREVFENDATRSAARYLAAHHAHDWDALQACLADDWIQDDHRSVVAGLLDHDQSLDSARIIFDGRGTFEHETIATRGRSLAAFRLRLRVPEPEASDEVLMVLRTNDAGRQARSISFDADDIEGALAELDRLYLEVEGERADLTQWFENVAWRAALRMKAASDARSWQSYAEVLAPDVEYHDNRGLQIHAIGDEALDLMRVQFSLDDWALDYSLLATRDDRLALIRVLVSFVDGAAGLSEVEALAVNECDDTGRIVATVAFDPEDVTGAHDELDRRHVALGGNPRGATLRHAVAARDWETLATVFAPDCRFADYRTAGWGVVSPAQFVDYQRAISELAPDARIWIDHSRSHGNVQLSTGHMSGTQAGGAWEIAYVSVGINGPDGRATHVENYELADMEIALARFDELVEREYEPFANAAWRAAVTQARAVNDGNWEAFRATLAPGAENDDRRHVIALVTRGADATELYRTIFTLERCRQERRLLASRGDRLALVHSTLTFKDRAAGPAEVVSLTLVEVDDRGLVTRVVPFDVDDLEAAYDELDARYIARRGPGRDFLRRFATLEPKGSEIAPDARKWVDHVRSSHGITLAVTRDVGTSEAGAGARSAISVSVSSPEGKVEVVEVYNLDDLAIARERFAELVAAREQPPANLAWDVAARMKDAFDHRDWDALVSCLHPEGVFDDRRRGFVMHLGHDAFVATMRVAFDMDRVTWRRTLLATAGDRVALVEDEVQGTDGEVGPIEVVSLTVLETADDGRVNGQTTFDPEDRDPATSHMHARAAQLAVPLAIPRNRAARAVEQPEWTLLAALVDDLCLHATPDGLVLHQVDASGTVTAQMEFGADAKRAATEEIARRFFERHGIVGGAAQLGTAMNARDLDAVRDCMAGSCVIEDHRRLRVGDLRDRDSHLAMLAPTFELAEDYLVEVLRVDAVEPWGSVGLSRNSGTTTDGGPFETLVVALTSWDDDGLITRIGIYEPEDAATAIARLRALDPNRPTSRR
jgi:DNA-binding SARP family transcriptional activator/tetratricopeptide (TPR) repeat protein